VSWPTCMLITVILTQGCIIFVSSNAKSVHLHVDANSSKLPSLFSFSFHQQCMKLCTHEEKGTTEYNHLFLSSPVHTPKHKHNNLFFFFIHCPLHQNKEPSWYQLVSVKNSQGLTFVMDAKVKKHCFQKSLHCILLLHVDVAGRPL